MKKTLLIMAMMTISTSVFASTFIRQSEKTIRTETYSSEQQAEQAGFKMIQDMRELSANELAFKLGVIDPQANTNSIKINNSEVTIETVYVEPDKASYRGLVEVDYQYQAQEEHN